LFRLPPISTLSSSSAASDVYKRQDARLHPFLVRDLHDLEPTICARLLLRNEIAHALHENLAAAARHGVEPRLHQLANHIARIHPEHLREAVSYTHLTLPTKRI